MKVDNRFNFVPLFTLLISVFVLSGCRFNDLHLLGDNPEKVITEPPIEPRGCIAMDTLKLSLTRPDDRYVRPPQCGRTTRILESTSWDQGNGKLRINLQKLNTTEGLSIKQLRFRDYNYRPHPFRCVRVRADSTSLLEAFECLPELPGERYRFANRTASVHTDSIILLDKLVVEFLECGSEAQWETSWGGNCQDDSEFSQAARSAGSAQHVMPELWFVN